MEKLQKTILIANIAILPFFLWAAFSYSGDPLSYYFTLIILSTYFFLTLVTYNDEIDERWSAVERNVSSVFLAFIVVFLLFYLPVYRFFLANWLPSDNFLSAVLKILFFSIVFVIFFVLVPIISDSAKNRSSSFSNWLNRESLFVFLRVLFLSFSIFTVLFSIRNSTYLMEKITFVNRVLPGSTCKWIDLDYDNFMGEGIQASGSDACFYASRMARSDASLCAYIDDSVLRRKCQITNVPE